MTRTLSTFFAAIIFLGGCGQANGSPVDYRPDEAGTVDHALCLLGFSAIPVREVDPGHHLIEATINGRTGNFVLDTGANVTLITTSHAERFGLRAGGTDLRAAARSGPGSGSQTNADQVAIETFEIGSIPIRQSRVMIADFGQLLGSLSRISGVEVAGIVGQDVLNEHRAVIDVARPMLYLMEGDRGPAPVSPDACQSIESDAEG